MVLASAHGRCRCLKTAFITPYGLYELNIIPFELCNAPATFERMMDNELRGLKYKPCLRYLDDMAVFSLDFNTHHEHLEEVFTCLTSARWPMNVKKCHSEANNLRPRCFQGRHSYAPRDASFSGRVSKTDHSERPPKQYWPLFLFSRIRLKTF